MISIKDRAPLHPGRVQLSPVTGQPNIFDMTREDSPTEAGTPLNRRTMQLLQADIRTLPIAAGNTVVAGDVVDVAGGEICKPFSSFQNTKYSPMSGSVQDVSGCALGESSISTLIKVGTSQISAYPGSITGKGGISYGNNISLGVNAAYPSVKRWDASSPLISYTAGSTFNCAIGSGNVASVSTATTNIGRTVPLDATSFVAIYQRQNLMAKVCTVSGTTITPQTEYQLSANIASGTILSVARLPNGQSGSKRVGVFYVDVSDGSKGKVVIATITGNVVSWGVPTVVVNISTTECACCADGDYLIIAYKNSSGISMKALLTSGAVVNDSASPLQITGTGASYPCLAVAGGKIVLAYSAPAGTAMVVSRSGVTLNNNAGYVFSSGAALYLSVDTMSSDKVVLSFADGGNGNSATNTVLSVLYNKIAGLFVADASQAIALQSGSAGQPVDVVFDGVAEFPGITAGVQIASRGVHGFAPQDGWLWVRPWWWASPRMVHFAFVGTGLFGVANPSTITFDFSPKIIVLTSSETLSSGAIAQIGTVTQVDFGTLPDMYTAGAGLSTSPGTAYAKRSGTTLYWYNTTSADAQCNAAAKMYYGVAWG